jgi:hypothetical protein
LARKQLLYRLRCVFPSSQSVAKCCHHVQRQRQIRRHRLGELRLGALGEQVGVGLADFVGEGDERQLLPRVEEVAPARETIALDTEAERFQRRQWFTRHGFDAPFFAEPGAFLS